jgi:hypothetical protein
MNYRKPGRRNAEPTEHKGAAHVKDWAPGATCDGCEEVMALVRASKSNRPPLVGVVPGGANDTEEFRFHMDFDKGMDAYTKAKKEGLQPKRSDLSAVKAAQDQVRSQEKAAKILKNETDLDGLNFAKGVNV